MHLQHAAGSCTYSADSSCAADLLVECKRNFVLFLSHSPTFSACQTVEDEEPTLSCPSLLLQMQVWWEMKALSDSVDFGLMARARAISEYREDFNDLSMESLHVRWSIVACSNACVMFVCCW